MFRQLLSAATFAATALPACAQTANPVVAASSSAFQPLRRSCPAVSPGSIERSSPAAFVGKRHPPASRPMPMTWLGRVRCYEFMAIRTIAALGAMAAERSLSATRQDTRDRTVVGKMPSSTRACASASRKLCRYAGRDLGMPNSVTLS